MMANYAFETINRKKNHIFQMGEKTLYFFRHNVFFSSGTYFLMKKNVVLTKFSTESVLKNQKPSTVSRKLPTNILVRLKVLWRKLTLERYEHKGKRFDPTWVILYFSSDSSIKKKTLKLRFILM